jgi:alpha-1,3-rhamnosyl/mannosyltransferase
MADAQAYPTTVATGRELSMRVAFDSRPGTDPRGIGRYVRCLLDALHGSPPPGADIVETHRPRHADVYHSPWIDGALLRSPCPMVVTLHDLAPLKRRGEYLRTGLRFRLRYLAVQRAVRVIVPTKAVAADAFEHLELGPERVVVIGYAVAPTISPRSAEEVSAARIRYGLPEEYLLWVGGLEHPDPRKRVAALTAARRRLPLVLVGPNGRWARELAGVKLTGQIPDEDLAAVYTGARALVFPSDEEGFGLPPVEALACGTPVVATEQAALREVLDGRITFVERDDFDGLMRTAEEAARPASPPPSWSWADAAQRTWEVYASAASIAADERERRRLRREQVNPG